MARILGSSLCSVAGKEVQAELEKKERKEAPKNLHKLQGKYFELSNRYAGALSHIGELALKIIRLKSDKEYDRSVIENSLVQLKRANKSVKKLDLYVAELEIKVTNLEGEVRYLKAKQEPITIM